MFHIVAPDLKIRDKSKFVFLAPPIGRQLFRLIGREAQQRLIDNTAEAMQGVPLQIPRASRFSDEQVATLNIKRDSFHPEWNYSISPRRSNVEQ